MVHSELLCFAFTQAHSSTLASLVDCIVEFYRPAEVAEARELLWAHCESALANKVTKKRRSGTPVDKQTARPFVEDICHWVCFLVNNDCYDSLPVKFFALNLRNTPPCKPEEINIFSLAARLTSLEEKFRQSETGEPTPISHPSRASAQNRTQTPSQASHVENSTHPQGASGVSAPDQPRQENPWQLVPGRKDKKKPRPQRPLQQQLRAATKQLTVVVGSSNADTAVKSCKPLKELFVYGVDSTCSADACKGYLEGKDVQPKRVHRVSKGSALRASFRITVDETDMAKMQLAEFWPEGVKCREWLRTIPTSPPQDGAPTSASPDDDDGTADSAHTSSPESTQGNHG